MTEKYYIILRMNTPTFSLVFPRTLNRISFITATSTASVKTSWRNSTISPLRSCGRFSLTSNKDFAFR